MDTLYQGNSKIDGERYDVSEKPNEERRPFKAVLDVGLTRTTNGNKVFAALKGATDGGLYVPHSNKRFPGYKKTADGETYDAKKHRARIFGAHVDQYMKTLKKSGEEDFKRQFSVWSKCLEANKVDSVEKLYIKVHDGIRKNPDFVKKEAKTKEQVKRDFLKKRQVKLTRDERKKRVAKKIEIALKKKK